jgi:hypothetical protein
MYENVHFHTFHPRMAHVGELNGYGMVLCHITRMFTHKVTGASNPSHDSEVSASARAARERASRAGAQARGAGFQRRSDDERSARASGLRSAPARPPAPSLARQVIVKAMIKDGKIAKWSYYGESARCASIFVDGVEGMSK